MANTTVANATGADDTTAVASDPLVWVGFTCAVLSSFGSCAALMLIRLSTVKEKHLPFCKRKLFFVGAFSNLACEAGLTTVALALTPLSLLAPVSGLTIVFGAFFAWIGLCGNKREKASPFEACALLVTVAGVGISAVFGPSAEGSPNLLDTTWRLLAPGHLAYALCGWTLALSWVALHTFDKRLGKYRPRADHPLSAPLSGFASGWLAAYNLSFLRIAMTGMRLGLFNGTGEIDFEIAKYPVVWLCFAALWPVAALQIYSLNVTMGAGGTNYVLPCYTVMIVVLSAVAGGIIFDEFARMDAQSMACFWVGVLVNMVGLFVLAIYQARRERIAKAADDAAKAAEEAQHSRVAEVAPAPVAVPPSTPSTASVTGSVAVDVQTSK